jgi:signal transduction protein with GAF and PtsI domain
MKKLVDFDTSDVKRKIEEMKKELERLGEELEYIEVDKEVAKNIEKNDKELNNLYQIKINDRLLGRAVRAAGKTRSVARGFIRRAIKG